MGWSLGYDSQWERWIGYGVPAYCDHPGCLEKIDRGLSYVCGGEPYGGEYGCGLYFCSGHRGYRTFGRGKNAEDKQVCARCRHGKPAFPKKPEHPEWIQHVSIDPSWAEWRNEHPQSPLLSVPA